ncbi:hypothetical protein K1719_014898 [Acacia pycnantha]|nr:hypothetical protein K1719_014898 [Acacia pycnantha]
MNSLGMSAEVATKLSKTFKLKDPDQPDSVLNLFRSYGFSDPQISKIVGFYPRVLLAKLEHNLLPRLRRAKVAFMNRSLFVEYVKFVKETGIEPSKAAFVVALIVVTQLRKSTWELKLDVFERCGWSRDVTLLAFSKFPNIMGMSEKKITSTMKFFVDEMGLQLEDIAGCPTILSYSMKKRIVPRWSVVKILKMMGLIKESLSLNSVIIANEKKFLDDFVFKFQENVPRLLEIYRGELGYFPEVRA